MRIASGTLSHIISASTPTRPIAHSYTLSTCDSISAAVTRNFIMATTKEESTAC